MQLLSLVFVCSTLQLFIDLVRFLQVSRSLGACSMSQEQDQAKEAKGKGKGKGKGKAKPPAFPQHRYYSITHMPRPLEGYGVGVYWGEYPKVWHFILQQGLTPASTSLAGSGIRGVRRGTLVAAIEHYTACKGKDPEVYHVRNDEISSRPGS